MIGEKVLRILNEQVASELRSAYLYLSMATYFDAEDLPGLARWMKVQAKEELEHAMKIYEFIYDRGGRVELTAIDKPESRWRNPLEVFERALEHERDVTRRIHNILEVVREEKDHATEEFIRWFISEQVEEEAQLERIVRKFRRLGGDPVSVYMLDRELEGRQK